MYHSCNQYHGYTRAEGDTTQQSNIMIWYDRYWGHNARTQGGAEEEVIEGMAGHFTWEASEVPYNQKKIQWTLPWPMPPMRQCQRPSWKT
jgi:hypothetical protein